MCVYIHAHTKYDKHAHACMHGRHVKIIAHLPFLPKIIHLYRYTCACMFISVYMYMYMYRFVTLSGAESFCY